MAVIVGLPAWQDLHRTLQAPKQRIRFTASNLGKIKGRLTRDTMYGDRLDRIT